MAWRIMNDSSVAVMEKERPLNRDVIKYIAMAAMLLNHIANVFLERGTAAYEIMADIGYFTAPVMIYFMVEGYEYTRSKKKYAQRLFIFALLSQIPFCLAFTQDGIIEFVAFNMLFTLLACFGIIHVAKTMPDHKYARVWIAGLILLTCFSDWGGLAPLFTYLFVKAGKDHGEQKKVWLCFALVFGAINLADGMGSMELWKNILHGLGCAGAVLLAGVCILYLYNGKRMERGRGFSKWFFYLFYPIHLLVLGILRLAI